MISKTPLGVFVVLVAVVCFVAVVPASANLLVNGSFETPIIDPTSHCGAYAFCHGFHSDPTYPSSDSNIGGWVVIGNSDIDCSGGTCVPNGAPAPVMLTTNQYQEPFGLTNNPLFFHVEDGNQAVDLTGEGNQNGPGVEDGIKQTVATIAGGHYDLSFWLGHQDGTAPGYTAGDAIIQLWLNGSFVTTFQNGANTPDDINWMLFNYDFVAAGSSTTVAFINATNLSNNYAGLDNVSLSSTVPEPASLVLLATGLAGLLTRRLRKR